MHSVKYLTQYPVCMWFWWGILTLHNEFVHLKWRICRSILNYVCEGIPGPSEERKVREILRFQAHGLTINLIQRKLMYRSRENNPIEEVQWLKTPVILIVCLFVCLYNKLRGISNLPKKTNCFQELHLGHFHIHIILC